MYFQKCIFQKCIFQRCIFQKCIYLKCIFAKCTRLACLLSFVSLFGAKENFALIIKPSRFLSRNFLQNITGWAQMIQLYDISTFVALVRFDRISLYPQKVAEERKPPRCVSLHVRTTKEEDGC